MMAQKCVPNNSGMVACKLSLSKADVMLAENDKLCDMSVACRNSDDDCVFAGPLEQLGYFLEICSKEGIRAKQLDVPYGFHSASMEPIVTPLKELCKSIKWSTPLIPVASNVLGRLFTPEDFTSDYFALHARRPVRFGDIIQNLKEQEAFNKAIILEIGAHPTTLPMIRGALDTSCQCLPTMKKEKDTWELLNAILGHFFKTRDSIKWRQVFEEDVRITDLPQYPLTNTNFVVPFEEISHMAVNSEQNPDSYIDTGFDLLPRLLKSEALSKEDSMQFETTTEILGPLIKGHNVGGTAICPASVFHELALEAAHVAMPPSEERLLVVRDMKFTHPLICIPREVSKVVRVYLVKTKIDAAADASEVKVMINVVQDNEESLCCTSFVSKETPTRVKRNLLRNGAMVDRQSSYLLNEHVPHNTFHKKLLYETIFARVVKYSPEYQSLIKLSLADSNYEAIGSFTLPESSRVEDFISPPVFTDTLLHAAGFAANLSVSSDEICICGHVESVEALNGFDYTQRFTVYCTLVDADDSTILADAYALNKTRQAVAIIRGMEFKKLRLSSFQRVLQHAMPASETNRARTESPPDLSYSTSATPPPGESGVATPENVPMDNHQGIKDSMNSTISQIYGSSDLDANKSLDALGIDSQMQIEIASKLAEAFPGNNISQSDILGCGTLKALEDLLILKIQPVNPEGLPETLSEGNSDVLQIAKLQPNPMQLQFSDSTESPIFLIHDGSGQASLYSRLQNLNRDVFAFSDPYFPRNASKITSLEQMAEDYASCVSKSQSPSLIIGGK